MNYWCHFNERNWKLLTEHWRNDNSLRWCLMAVLNMINILILKWLLHSAGEQVGIQAKRESGKSTFCFLSFSVLRNQVPTQHQASKLSWPQNFYEKVKHNLQCWSFNLALTVTGNTWKDSKVVYFLFVVHTCIVWCLICVIWKKKGYFKYFF